MAIEQSWFGIGNLGADLDLTFTNGGRAVAKGSLGVERRYQQNGEWKSETNWFNLVIWGELGEHAAQSLFKGTRVVVVGKIANRSYEKDGQTRYISEVLVDSIGPDLRWATAQVERIQRSTSNRDDGYGGYE